MNNQRKTPRSDWKVIQESVKEQVSSQVANGPHIDLHPRHAKNRQLYMIGTTVGVIVLIFVAFAFAPWSNPLKSFMGSVTQDTNFEDLFNETSGLDQNKDPTSDFDSMFTDSPNTETTNGDVKDPLAALFGEESDISTTATSSPTSPEDDLAALFDDNSTDIESAKSGTSHLADLPTSSEDEESPTAPADTVDYVSGTVPIAAPVADDEDLETLIPEALPEATDIVVTSPGVIPSYSDQGITADIQPTPDEIIGQEDAFAAKTPSTSPFPVNTHTVAYLIPPGSAPAQPTNIQPDDVEILRSAAPDNAQVPTARLPKSVNRTPDSGPGTLLLFVLFLVTALGGFYFSRLTKKAVK